MSKNEKNVKAVSKTEVVNVVKAVITNKESYNKCNDLMLTITKAYTDIITICKAESNTLPTSTIARMLHLLGKAEGSRQQQFNTAFDSITKRLEKDKKALISAAKKEKKAKEKHAELLKSLSPEQKKELAKELANIKI